MHADGFLAYDIVESVSVFVWKGSVWLSHIIRMHKSLRIHKRWARYTNDIKYKLYTFGVHGMRNKWKGLVNFDFDADGILDMLFYRRQPDVIDGEWLE